MRPSSLLRTPLLLSLAVLAGCASRADRVFVTPGRVATGSSGAQPGSAIKQIRAKQPPTEVVGDDGSLCRLTTERFATVGVGDWLNCEWTIAPDTTATISRAGA
jgi:hypothetical protein